MLRCRFRVWLTAAVFDFGFVGVFVVLRFVWVAGLLPVGWLFGTFPGFWCFGWWPACWVWVSYLVL